MDHIPFSLLVLFPRPVLDRLLAPLRQLALRDTRLFLQLARSGNLPDPDVDLRILILGSGLGRHAFCFAQAGATVVAVDPSQVLTDNAKRLAVYESGFAQPVEFHTADLRHLPGSISPGGGPDGTYHLVLIPDGALCEVGGEEQVRAVFVQAVKQLVPGGRLICDVPNPTRIIRNLTEPFSELLFQVHLPRLYAKRRRSLDRRAGVLVDQWTVQAETDTKYELRTRLLELRGLDRMAAECGLWPMDPPYGDTEEAELGLGLMSPRLIAVYERRM